jgi:lipopolysaccharide/colanic/teichoic acid biosynthesis glycosyltransferase
MRRDAQRLLDELLTADPVARTEWERYGRVKHDPRVLGRVGAAMRRWSIDELPQLWQVLAGKMALVGPRPVERWIADQMDPAFLAKRRSRRPGLTGPWQVSGRNDVDLATLALIEAEYLAHRTFVTDLRILARTPNAVLSGAGAM